MSQLTPYIRFAGKCAEAMNFYKDVFGGELEMQKVGDTPMGAQMPAELHENIMHADLRSGSIILFGSDMTAAGTVDRGDGMSLALWGTIDEMKALWAKLVEGGTVGHALTEEYFGTYGDLVDKYGVSWMFQADAVKEA